MPRQSKPNFAKGLSSLKNFAAAWGRNFSLFIIHNQKIIGIAWNQSYWECLQQQSAYNFKHNQQGDHSFVITVGLRYDAEIRDKPLAELYRHLPTPEQLFKRDPEFVGDYDDPDMGLSAWQSEVTPTRVRGISID